ncbi:MAG TPA: heme-binding protein [Gemmatimonadales bacterium]|jgi:uncharacterized protein GlcG (DUF336 family)|nr:heme-binding protein [Gemmatimonadales bacterium]
MSQELTAAESRSIVAAVLERAATMGTTMTVAVVDAGGYLVALQRMDGARIIGPDIAIAKAFTAAAFRTPSGDVAARLGDAPHLVQSVRDMTQGRFMPHPGGIPILRDGQLIGAVGVGGGSADQDVEVARGAISDAGLTPG